MNTVFNKLFIGCPMSHCFDHGKYNQSLQNDLLYIKHITESKGKLLFSAPIEEKFQSEPILTDDKIAERDFKWISDADLCAFLFPTDLTGNPIQTQGTCMELGFSVAMQKPILIFWDSINKASYSPMFRGLQAYNVIYYDISMFRRVLNDLV